MAQEQEQEKTEPKICKPHRYSPGPSRKLCTIRGSKAHAPIDRLKALGLWWPTDIVGMLFGSIVHEDEITIAN